MAEKSIPWQSQDVAMDLLVVVVVAVLLLLLLLFSVAVEHRRYLSCGDGTI